MSDRGLPDTAHWKTTPKCKLQQWQEQAHTSRCFETIPVQTPLWSAVAQRAQLMLLSSLLSLTAFGSSGGFLRSVFVNTREEEQLAATQARCGMSGEAVPWQSSRGQREGALWQSADYSAGHGAVYEDVIGAVVREKAVPAAAVGWGVKPGCVDGASIDAINGLTILFGQRWSKRNTPEYFLSVKVYKSIYRITTNKHNFKGVILCFSRSNVRGPMLCSQEFFQNAKPSSVVKVHWPSILSSNTQ